MTSGGQDQKSVQTCLLVDPPSPMLTYGGWLPKAHMVV